VQSLISKLNVSAPVLVTLHVQQVASGQQPHGPDKNIKGLPETGESTDAALTQNLPIVSVAMLANVVLPPQASNTT